MKVYQAINAVQADLSKAGITKDRKNVQQGYMFRGVDDVFNALSPLLAKHGLCILPRVMSRAVDVRKTLKGTDLYFVTVEMAFDFVSSEDGSKHTIKTYGEAMDSGDKATNKAMSAAYKYAAIQAFAIPTEGDNDPDGSIISSAPSDYEAENLPALREAAMKGTKSLQEAFGNIESGPQKAALWDAHGKALKAAAAAADNGAQK